MHSVPVEGGLEDLAVKLRRVDIGTVVDDHTQLTKMDTNDAPS